MHRPSSSLLLVLLAACSDSGVTQHNVDPVAEITSHQDGDTVSEGYAVTLRGSVGDDDDALDSLSVAWLVAGVQVCEEATPDAAGVVVCDHTFVPAGGQVVLEVADAHGGRGSDTLSLGVTPTDAPTATITSPVADGRYYADQLITFSALVGDAEDAPSALVLSWETEALGELGLDLTVGDDGAVEGFSRLPAGDHWLRLHVTDTTGKETIDSVLFTVGPDNSAPTCSLLAPVDGAAGALGDELRLDGMVGDVDVPVDVLSVVFTSSLDGALGAPTVDTDGRVRLSWDALSAGTHLLSLEVVDDVGATCVTSVYYTVGTPPSVVIDAPLDGEVVNEGDELDIEVTVSDTESDPTELTLSWASDLDGELGTEGADFSGYAALAATLSAGDHRLTVTATDPEGLSAVDAVSVTVNALPTAPTVTLSPDPAGTDDALTASATGSVDPDSSGTLSYTYDWYVDGVLSGASTSAILPAAYTTKGEVWRVVVTPNDGWGDGAPGEASLTIGNTAPTVSVSLTPTTARTDDTLTAAPVTSDTDGDAVSVTYDWFVDGVLVRSGASSTLSGSYFDKGEEVVVEAVADDGVTTTTAASAGVVIANTPPGAPTLAIDPSGATAGDDLWCEVTVPSVDADGDTVTYSMDWSADGVAYTAPTTTTWTDDTVDGTDVGASEMWMCVATPHDGEDVGTTASASVTTTTSSWSGTIEMPSTSTVDGFNHGEWSALNGGGRVATRIDLTGDCVNPRLAFYQHSSADTSITGSFYVMNSSGTVLDYSTYATYSGCNDCWLGPSSDLSLTMSAGTVYYLGFSNDSGGDMSGPSIYLDASSRTVGIATFSDPRADKPASPTRGLPSTTVSWQNRWRVICN